MSTGKRNRAWPIAIVLSVAVVGVLAAFIALAVQQPAPASAHDPAICHTPFADLNPECANHTTDDGTPPANGGGTTTPVPDMPATGDRVTSSSSTGSGAPEIKLIIESMPGDMSVGSSIVLYLEDDFQEPDSIPVGSVYLVAEGSASNLRVSPHPSDETADINQSADGQRRPGVRDLSAQAEERRLF